MGKSAERDPRHLKIVRLGSDIRVGRQFCSGKEQQLSPRTPSIPCRDPMGNAHRACALGSTSLGESIEEPGLTSRVYTDAGQREWGVPLRRREECESLLTHFESERASICDGVGDGGSPTTSSRWCWAIGRVS